MPSVLTAPGGARLQQVLGGTSGRGAAWRQGGGCACGGRT